MRVDRWAFMAGVSSGAVKVPPTQPRRRPRPVAGSAGAADGNAGEAASDTVLELFRSLRQRLSKAGPAVAASSDRPSGWWSGVLEGDRLWAVLPNDGLETLHELGVGGLQDVGGGDRLFGASE